MAKRTELPILYRKRNMTLYIFLRAAVIFVMVMQASNQNYANVFLCVLTLVLFMIPTFIDRRLHINLPSALEIMILLFIFSAEILGEVREYYLSFPYWDTMLHTINGFLMGAIGFSLIDILNENERFHIQMTPMYVALTAFCFSMTVGVVWEFFEFGMDIFFLTDMQKDTVLPVISSVMLNPEGINIPAIVPVESMIVNGQEWHLGGYLDIGLHDTMKDLLVNFIGAVTFSVIGFLYAKGRGSDHFLRSLIPTRKTPAQIEATQKQVRDDRLRRTLRKEALEQRRRIRRRKTVGEPDDKQQ